MLSEQFILLLIFVSKQYSLFLLTYQNVEIRPHLQRDVQERPVHLHQQRLGSTASLRATAIVCYAIDALPTDATWTHGFGLVFNGNKTIDAINDDIISEGRGKNSISLCVIKAKSRVGNVQRYAVFWFHMTDRWSDI